VSTDFASESDPDAEPQDSLVDALSTRNAWVEVMVVYPPKLLIEPSPFKTTFDTSALGFEKCGVLAALKASARNCRCHLSRT